MLKKVLASQLLDDMTWKMSTTGTQRRDSEDRLEGKAAEGVLPTSDKGLHISVKPCTLAACRDAMIRTSVH